jgi:hypothetical protein
MQQQPPKSSLLNLEGNWFEFDHTNGAFRPYGDKPTSDQMLMAQQLGFLEQYIPSMRFTPLAGSQNYRGIYTLSKEAWLGMLLKDLEIPFVPEQIEPNPGPRGGWNVLNPETGAWEIYK